MSQADTSDMDQERFLRAATHGYKPIEKPLKWGPKVETLEDLIAELYKAFETPYVNIEIVNHLMLAYQSNPKEWQKYAKFDRYKYTRNLVDAGNGKFNLIILCWGEGHGSAIHDHADSHCFMKMLQGSLVETQFEMPENNDAETTPEADIGTHVEGGGEMLEIGRKTISTNDVAYINDDLGLHRVENPSHSETAVSLHLYCPPFNECSVFLGGKKTKCPVTFYSTYGVRQS